MGSPTVFKKKLCVPLSEQQQPSNCLEWETVAQRSVAREDAAISSLVEDGDANTTSSSLLVVGGRTSETTSLDCVELFDTTQREWSTLPNLLTPRCGCSVASIDGRAYVFGGLSDKNERLASCESFDWKKTQEEPSEEEAQEVPDMSSSRWYGASVSLPLHGDIVVLGGRDGQWQELSTVEVYDTKANEWNAAASMSSPRFGCGAIRIAPSKLMVVGGFDGTTWLDTAEIYDYELDEWSLTTHTMPGALEFCTVTVLGTDHVLVSGKKQGGARRGTKVYVYSILQGSWSTINTHLNGISSTIVSIGSQALALDQQATNSYVTSNLMALVEDDFTEATSRCSSSGASDLGKRRSSSAMSSATASEDDASTPWWTSEASSSQHFETSISSVGFPEGGLDDNANTDQVSVLAEDEDATSRSHRSFNSTAVSQAPFSAGGPSGRRRSRRSSVDQLVTIDSSGRKVHYTGHISITHSRPHGKGTMRWADMGDVYKGAFRHGHRDGFGKVDYANGDSFEGLFEKDLKNGRGIFRSYNDGRAYDGNYTDDLRDDPNGTLTWSNGTIYVGSFVKGKRTGKGAQRFPSSGVRYQGDFVAGKYHGFGICEFADGSVYRGGWFRGQAHGQGRLVTATGEVIHDGQWECDGPV
jgi:hypothetical protein